MNFDGSLADAQVARDHLVHLAHIDADATSGRIQVPLQRGTRAIVYDGDPVLRTGNDNPGHFFRGVCEDHGIGRLVLDPCGRVAVLFADGVTGLQPFTELLLENADRRGDAGDQPAAAGKRVHISFCKTGWKHRQTTFGVERVCGAKPPQPCGRHHKRGVVHFQWAQNVLLKELVERLPGHNLHHTPNDIGGVAVSSVVPSITATMRAPRGIASLSRPAG